MNTDKRGLGRTIERILPYVIRLRKDPHELASIWDTAAYQPPEMMHGLWLAASTWLANNLPDPSTDPLAKQISEIWEGRLPESDSPGEAPAADQHAHRDRTLRDELATETARRVELQIKLADAEKRSEMLRIGLESARADFEKARGVYEDALRESGSSAKEDQRAWDLFAAAAIAGLAAYTEDLDEPRTRLAAEYADELVFERVKRRDGK